MEARNHPKQALQTGTVLERAGHLHNGICSFFCFSWQCPFSNLITVVLEVKWGGKWSVQLAIPNPDRPALVVSFLL